VDEALQRKVFEATNESLRGRTLTELLVDIAKQPFQKTRFAAYHNMRSLASQTWGRAVCVGMHAVGFSSGCCFWVSGDVACGV
jgi:hypothetical protein